MRMQELTGKSVCILGFGREGQATLRAIEKYAPGAEVTIVDANVKAFDAFPELKTENYTLKTGQEYLYDLRHNDVIIKSPGIPPNEELRALKKKVTSSTQLFLDTIAESGAIVIGVTGSKGKSTTASLIYEILKAAKKDTHLIGNIGEPALDHIEDAKSNTFFVQEMSSYQLMDLMVSPEIAVITSFFPEHLDYHASAFRSDSGQAPLSTSGSALENYKEAKKHIARFQKSTDVIFYNAHSDGAREIAMESTGKRIPFSADECPISIEETHLIGEHNRSNITAAYKVAEHLGVDRTIVFNAIRNFQGLAHRLQSLGIHHGIEWIDDAISTTPESAIAALDALGDRVVTIILGGQDRGNDFTELGKRIAASPIKNAILFPESGARIKEAINKAGAKVKITEVQTMQEAVDAAKHEMNNQKSIINNPLVLLSPASPSYGIFKNFEEKGDAFKQAIIAK